MLSFIKNIGIFEISLVQVIFYGIFWFVDDYFALLLSVIMVVILFAVLVVSLISELLERSRVPVAYFKIMAVSIVIPLLVGIFFASVLGITAFRPV